MMSLPTDSAYKTGILTRKKYFILTLMSKIWPKRVILPILGHFGGHFEKRPLFWISRSVENMQDDVASSCFCIQNWYFSYIKHFILILGSKVWPKVILWYFRTFWRPFWMAPSIWNLQNFDNMSDDTSVHFLEFIWHTFTDQKLPIFRLLAGTADFSILSLVKWWPSWISGWKWPKFVEIIPEMDFSPQN